ncbi:MAG: hypothetical protein J3Q66DRAFT_367572 [Benniella sp.]|nr:MAG: hypothetical protein J3Q66DRAFT_367572 [Benniella sp.]
MANMFGKDVSYSSHKRSRPSQDNKSESDAASDNSDVSRVVLEADPPATSTTATYYLSGDGSTRCSVKLWEPWIVKGKDFSGNLWRFRQDVCRKARALQPLLGSVEKLAVNHVYLFEPSDSSSQLFNALGAEVWSHVTKSTLEKKVPKETLAELNEFAFDLSGMSHDDAQRSVMSWEGNGTTKKVLSGLVADKFLWDASDFNELELIQHLHNPFLTTFVSVLGRGRWDKMFLPSQQRKSEAMAEGRGLRPDFSMSCEAGAKKCHVFIMEAKKSEQGTVLQNDLEKVALLMKDAIDDMGKCKIDISKVKLFGMVIVGAEGAVYSMELPSRGLYIMRRYGTIYAPRSQHDLHVLAGSINVFMNLKEELTNTIRVCRGPLLKAPADLTRPSFGTPIKVTRTRIKSGFDPSPSLRPRANPGKSKKRA